MAEIPVPTEQSKAFMIAICERLGINPDEVRKDTMNLTWGTDPYATIHVELFIPSSEVFDIWNNVAKQYPHQP